jgi:toxin FitB
MILLDTNVISELMRPDPDQTVLAWFDAHSDGDVWTSAVVIAELLSGIDLMPMGRKQRALREHVEGMIAEDFLGRILDFDLDAARQYGQVLAARQRMGRPIDEMDAEIAAVARVHGATLATRNTNDFIECGLTVVNPWIGTP